MKIILFGPQGSGKGTYAKRLSPIFNIPHISTGDIFRDEIKRQTELGEKVQSFVNNGMYVPDDIVNKVVEKRLGGKDCSNGFMLDGYPRTTEQAKFLDEFSKPDIVINLVVPLSVLIQRLSSRRICRNCGSIFNLLTLKPKKAGICDNCGGSLYQREDDTPKEIKRRLDQYETLTKPLLNFYNKRKIVANVECNQADIPPEIIVEKIRQAIINRLRK